MKQKAANVLLSPITQSLCLVAMALSAVGAFGLSLYKCHNELVETKMQEIQVATTGSKISWETMKQQAPSSKPPHKSPRNPLKTPGHRKSRNGSSALLPPLGVLQQLQHMFDIVPKDIFFSPAVWTIQSAIPARRGPDTESSGLHNHVQISNAEKRVDKNVGNMKGDPIDILTYLGTGMIVGMAVGMGVGMAVGVGIFGARRRVLFSTMSSLLILICSATVLVACCCNYFLALHHRYVQ